MMLKKTMLFIFMGLLLAFNAKLMAQAKLSNSSKVMLDYANQMNQRSAKKEVLIKKVKQFFPIRKEKEVPVIGGIMKVAANFDTRSFLALGGKIGTKGAISTFRIPMHQLSAMTQIEGISYIQVDQKVQLNLDEALKDAKVDQVHQGINLPQAYTGKDVVVGVIDAGFQLNHATFRDDEGNVRVKRVWIQGLSEGNSPAGFSYGTELTEESEMLAMGSTETRESHGSHVAGIAGGRGVGENNQFSGVAREADLAFVQLNIDEEGESAIMDGISYIFDYAASVGKPAVVNMSLGSHIGPHDGTSLLDQFIDNAVGSGKIIIGSVGNEGESPLHIEKMLDANNPLQTIPGTFNDGNAEISIWGEPATEFFFSNIIF